MPTPATESQSVNLAALHTTPMEATKSGFHISKGYKRLIPVTLGALAVVGTQSACVVTDWIAENFGNKDAAPTAPEKMQLFQSAEEVSAVRGGDPSNWVLKVEVRDGMTDGQPDPNDIRYGHGIDGSTPQVNLVKNEWMYRGAMTDLKPEYQIPQTVEGIAAQLNEGLSVTDDAHMVRPENIRVVRITHDKNSAGYAPWMDLWQVEEGTIVGYELMQNHQTIDGNTGGDGLVPYEFNLPPGAVAEAYDDRQSERPDDDVAATIFNADSQSMKLFVTGATVWPWGDPNALIVEQSNFTNGAPGATSFAMVDGKIVPLSAGSNFLSPQTAHAIVTVDQSTGRIVLTGAVNSPGKAPVVDQNAK